MRPGVTTTEFRATVGAFITAGVAILADTFGVAIPEQWVKIATEAAFAAAILYPLARGVAKTDEVKRATESSEFKVALLTVIGGVLAIVGAKLPAEMREMIGQGITATLASFIASRGLAKRPSNGLVEIVETDPETKPRTGGALEAILEDRTAQPP